MVRIMFIILTAQFTHCELPLCYFMFLLNLEQGHPLRSPHQLQKARDNKKASLCLQEVRRNQHQKQYTVINYIEFWKRN